MYKKASRRTGGSSQYGWSNYNWGADKKRAAAVKKKAATSRRRKLVKKTYQDRPSERFYLNCSYSEKEECKAKGGRWDPTERKWYVPYGVDRRPFVRWQLSKK